MFTRHPYDASLAVHLGHERIQRAAEGRLARTARRHPRRASPFRPVGRLLVRLGAALGAEPATPGPTRTLRPVRPR